ncbi:MAG: beta-lactamase family protein [Clostridiales bacterium]|nr:beta-lactamase family protein [Clostridiales bacterium]
MNSKRIDRAADCMETILREEIAGGGLPGASFAVLYKGVTVMKRHINYAPDAIFRVYSMSKPITAVAAQILWERGMLDWNTPLSHYLPEFADMDVITEHGLEKASRPIYLIDLLRMTSGIVYPGEDAAGAKMDTLFRRIQDEIAHGKQTPTQEFCRLIAQQPLAFHPGERWRYGLSCDVMGAVIEKVADQPLSEFYEKEIFRPLDMKDTGFYVPKEKQARFTTLYEQTAATGADINSIPQTASGADASASSGITAGANTQFAAASGSQPIKASSPLRYKEAVGRHLCLTKCLTPPAFESGGAGIVSTLDDYSKFADMLAHYGVGNGCRILGRKSVECFEHAQLDDAQKKTIDFDHIHGFSYGHFMRVYDDRTEAATMGDPGEFGWDGWTGPYFFANPKEELAYVLMLQVGGYCNAQMTRRLRNAVYSIVV